MLFYCFGFFGFMFSSSSIVSSCCCTDLFCWMLVIYIDFRIVLIHLHRASRNVNSNSFVRFVICYCLIFRLLTIFWWYILGWCFTWTRWHLFVWIYVGEVMNFILIPIYSWWSHERCLVSWSEQENDFIIDFWICSIFTVKQHKTKITFRDITWDLLKNEWLILYFTFLLYSFIAFILIKWKHLVKTNESITSAD